MLQLIDKELVFVVDFDTMPELPITGLTAAEEMYKNLVQIGNFPGEITGTLASLDTKITYAEALTDAIETGIITEPGKYGICLRPSGSYEIFKIIE